MRDMVANETYGERASNIEQVLETAPYKAAAKQQPTIHHETIQVRQTRHAGTLLEK